MSAIDPNYSYLRSKHFNFTPIYDGAVHRPPEDNAWWFVGYILDDGRRYLIFGDHRTKHEHRVIEGVPTSEHQALAEAAKAAVTRDHAQIIEKWIQAARSAESLVALAKPVAENEPELPYFADRGLKRESLRDYVLRDPELPHAAIIPIIDADQRIWSYQRIHANGMKEQQSGGRFDGTFMLIRRATLEPRAVIIAEGAATALTVADALGAEGEKWCLVVAAVNAGNMPNVAYALAEKYANAAVILAADNDHAKEVNAGLLAAEKAKILVPRAETYAPDKERLGDRGSDWDDLRQALGAEEVANLWLPIVARVSQAVAVETEAKAKKVKPGERQLALELYEDLGLKDVVQIGPNSALDKKDFFAWTGTHWESADSRGNFLNRLEQQCYKKLGMGAKSKDAASLLRSLVSLIPYALQPDRLFQCNPESFNFKDGTVDVIRGSGGEHQLLFRKHSREDLFTYVLPWAYRDNTELPRNGKFKEYLERRLADGGPEHVRILKQILGACMVPFFPHVFFIIGKSNTGKSTLLKLAEKVAGEENVSRLDPTLWHGFHLVSMAGKLVNIVMDINTRREIHDDVFKQIRDRRPVYMNRKGKLGVTAALPGLHLFGGNDLPRSVEGGSEAMANRVKVLHFTRVVSKSEVTVDLAELIWTTDRGSVIDAAFEGLQDLLGSGFQYADSATQSDSMAEWARESDPVKAWLADAQEGLIPALDGKVARFVGGKAIVPLSALYGLYLRFSREAQVRVHVGPKQFSKACVAAGFTKARVGAGAWGLAGWEIVGSGVRGPDDSAAV